MKKGITLFVFLAISVFFYSCRNEESSFNKPEFKKTETAEFEILGEELFGYNYISDLKYYNGNIILLALNADNSKNIHLFNTEGKGLASALMQGRGPMEALFVSNSCFDKNSGKMTILDNMAKRAISFSIDTLAKTGEIPNITTIQLKSSIPSKVKKTNSGYLIMDTDYTSILAGTSKRFILLDENSDTLSVYNKYPYETDVAHRFHMDGLSATLDVSLNGEKAAFVPSHAAILETFDVSDNQIRPIAVGRFIEPKFVVPEGTMGIEPTEEMTIGFGDVYAGEKYVYTVYDGETKPMAQDARDHLWSTKIAVFDYNCKPARLIKTDYHIERICVDESENMLYAVVYDADFNFFIGRIGL